MFLVNINTLIFLLIKRCEASFRDLGSRLVVNDVEFFVNDGYDLS